MRQGDNHIVVKKSGPVLKGLKVVAAAAALFAAGSAGAQQLFSWGTDPITNNGPVPAGYIPAPFLNSGAPVTGNSAAVGAYLPAQPVKALKVDNLQSLTAQDVANVYGPNNVRYSFADFEGASAGARSLVFRNQVAGSAGTGPSFLANTSYVGNFDFTPLATDPTRRPGGDPGSSGYFAAGLNMANEQLYPGGGSFRSPLAAAPANQSSAPNLRSSLFTLPVTRASLTTASLPLGHKHIPYISRFNVSGGETNGTFNGTPAFYFDAAHGTAGQALSRGDFGALVAHYRARGVNAVHLLDPGMANYTRQEAEADVASGFNFAPFANVFAASDARLASLDTTIRTNGSLKSLEDAGVVLSGVYSLTQNKLELLLSNLSDNAVDVSMLNKVGGKSIPALGGSGINVLAGQHKLLDFTGAGTAWTLLNPGGTAVFTDLTGRDGVGVPEPTMVGGLALLGCFGLGRRRKNRA